MGHVKQEKSANGNNTNNCSSIEPPSIIEFISLKEHSLQKTHSESPNNCEESRALGSEKKYHPNSQKFDESKAIGFEKFQNQYPKQLNAEELISQINCNLNSSGNPINNAVAHHHNNSNNVQNNNDSNNNSHSNNRSSQQSQSRVQHHQQQQQQRAESIEGEDIEKGSEDLQRTRRQKPLLRRLYSFIRNLWIGATFNVGKAGKCFINFIC